MANAKCKDEFKLKGLTLGPRLTDEVCRFTFCFLLLTWVLAVDTSITKGFCALFSIKYARFNPLHFTT